MTRLAQHVDLRELDAVALLAHYACEPEWVRANMVISLDGSYRDTAGSSRGLSCADDLRVMLALRALSDCIVVGANTARTERYAPGAVSAEFVAHVAQGPSIAVVTRTFDFPADNPMFSGETKPIVFASAHDAHAHPNKVEQLRKRADVHLASGAVTGDWVRDELALLGLTKLLCEGGPLVIDLFRSAAVLDEIAVTMAPLIRGDVAEASSRADNHSAFGATASTMRTTHTASAGDHTFLRCVIHDEPPTLES